MNSFKTPIHPNSNLIHDVFADLVNNFVFYHNNDIDKNPRKVWDNRPPSYSGYPSIFDLYDDIIKNPHKYIDQQSITVRCPVSKLYTCDRTLSQKPGVLGFDRLHKYGEIVTKCTDYLERYDGYFSKSELLHGMVRWIYDEHGNVIDFAICKDRGNARSYMALTTNGGQDIEIAITLNFHDINPNLSSNDMREIEAQAFNNDAVERRGFDPQTKFASGYIAGKAEYIALKEYLDDLDVDFGDVVSADRIANGKKAPKYHLSALSKLNFGKDGNEYGDFTKWLKTNISAAIGTLKKIHDGNKFTSELSITTIMIFARSFYYLTESKKVQKVKGGKPVTWDAIISKEDLQRWFILHYTKKSENAFTGQVNLVNNLSELGRSGADKDLSWKAFDTFLPSLLADIKEIKERKNDYKHNHPAINAYIESIEVSQLRTEARLVLNKSEVKELNEAA